MASPRFAWGIDVGNCALKAIKLVRENGELSIADFEIIEHEQILSNAGDNRESLIHKALNEFAQRHPEKGGAVSVAVGGQSSFARFIKLPPVEPKKIPEIVRFEAIQQIPFPLDDVEWNYQLFQSPDSPDVEVGIFAMRKELIERHIAYFTEVNLNLQTVQMSPLAVYNAMRFDNRIEGTTMIIDLGAENTDLIIAEGETIWLRSIPIGGNSFTDALVKSFKLTFAKAEDLKRNAASSKYARQIFQAMRPVFADLVVEIQRSIGFYSSVHRDSQITKVIALGGTFRLPGLQKYLEQNLQLNVQRLNGLGNGAPDDPKLATTFNDNLLGMAGAYGLAVQAMGEATITSSLLPARIRRVKMWQEKTKWFGLTAALVALGVGIPRATMMLASQPYNSEENSNLRGGLSTDTKSATELDSQWSSLEQAGGPDRQQIQNVYSLLEYRELAPAILNDVIDTLPKLSPGKNPANPADITSTARTARNQIVLRSTEIKYVPDMTNFLSAVGNPTRLTSMLMQNSGGRNTGTFNDPGTGAGGGPPGGFSPFGAPPGANTPGGGGPPPSFSSGSAAGGTGGEAGPTGPRGFLVTIEGTTPNRNGTSAIEDNLVKALIKLKVDKAYPQHSYVFKHALVVEANKVRDRQALLKEIVETNQQLERLKQAQNPTAGAPGAATPPGGGPPTGMGFGGPGGGTGGAALDLRYAVDSVTGEPMLDDTWFKVVALVVIDPETPAPTEPAN